MICENLNDEGRLSLLFELPSKEKSHNELRFAPGARDGCGIFHSSLKEPETVANQVFGFLKSGETERIKTAIEGFSVILFIDQLLSTIRSNAADIDRDMVARFAQSLAFRSDDEEMVKLGIALLGLIDLSDTPEVQEKLITLGLFEELTLYVVVAACGWDNGNDAVFRIAQKVSGWGKIHAVERLKPSTTEIKEWILNEGCSNDVMDSYLGLECAVKGDLIGALRRDAVTPELFESISVIIDALIDEGPVEGISVYGHAEEALLRFLIMADEHTTTLRQLWRLLNVKDYLESFKSSKKDEMSALVTHIISKAMWRELIYSTLSDSSASAFFFAANAAQRMGFDAEDLVFSAVKSDPIKNQGHLPSLYKNPEYAKELTALYESILPLDKMATGMGDHLFAEDYWQEHSALDFVLQELGKYPNLGESLLKTALGSPVVRERNFACRVLHAWSEKLSQPVRMFSPELFHMLEGTMQQEVNPDTKKRMEELLEMQFQ